MSVDTIEKVDYSRNENGKNSQDAYCLAANCDSLIFRSDTAPLIELEQSLPLKGKDEVVKKFWQFDDIYQFENITFTKSPNGQVKYLACCDCEFGPIGFQDLQSQICYVAADRISYKSS